MRSNKNIKTTEGDPHIKGKRRQIAQEIAYQEGPTGGVKRAQAVVTNPTHLAIAIGYERDVDAAPYIFAMGKDILAERMIKIAENNDIPVVRNIPLRINYGMKEKFMNLFLKIPMKRWLKFSLGCLFKYGT